MMGMIAKVREFNNGCRFEGIGLVKTVPSTSCGRYRRSIIDRSSCKESKAVIR